MTTCANGSSQRHYEVRQKSALGQPKPLTDIERACYRCGASFLGLAPGKTGERGLWGGRTGWQWFCSQECFDGDPFALSEAAS